MTCQRREEAHENGAENFIAALALALGLTAEIAWGQAAKFFGEPFAVNLQQTGSNICDLTVGPIEQRGLGSTVTYSVEADVAVGLACRNPGGNFPTDPKKQAAAGTASEETTVEPKGGRVRGVSFTIDFSELDFTPDLNCPGGQVAVLACCSYRNIALTDITNNVSADLTSTSLALNTNSDLFNNDCTVR